ncbi:hypothetical protein EVAR_40039_1 [Eumeta japonica]|uniref:Uncharacterized protein n=1 Tax=Eumeta variegata TaxID=151549 RepID=A0A4C1W9D1_EUMVA|nr:hypothetical protein EVAR_40039_1 [Eumeta japonica]
MKEQLERCFHLKVLFSNSNQGRFDQEFSRQIEPLIPYFEEHVMRLIVLLSDLRMGAYQFYKQCGLPIATPTYRFREPCAFFAAAGFAFGVVAFFGFGALGFRRRFGGLLGLRCYAALRLGGFRLRRDGCGGRCCSCGGGGLHILGIDALARCGAGRGHRGGGALLAAAAFAPDSGRSHGGRRFEAGSFHPTRADADSATTAAGATIGGLLEPEVFDSSLYRPDTPLPLVCINIPDSTALFRYFLMKDACFSAFTLYWAAIYLLITCRDELLRSFNSLIVLLTISEVFECVGFDFGFLTKPPTAVPFGFFAAAAGVVGTLKFLRGWR